MNPHDCNFQVTDYIMSTQLAPLASKEETNNFASLPRQEKQNPFEICFDSFRFLLAWFVKRLSFHCFLLLLPADFYWITLGWFSLLLLNSCSFATVCKNLRLISLCFDSIPLVAQEQFDCPSWCPLIDPFQSPFEVWNPFHSISFVILPVNKLGICQEIDLLISWYPFKPLPLPMFCLQLVYT